MKENQSLKKDQEIKKRVRVCKIVSGALGTIGMLIFVLRLGYFIATRFTISSIIALYQSIIIQLALANAIILPTIFLLTADKYGSEDELNNATLRFIIIYFLSFVVWIMMYLAIPILFSSFNNSFK